MPDLGWNKGQWDGSYNWATGGEEWSDVWGGSEAQWFGSLYPRLHRVLPADRILEIAPGFGRWSKFLIGSCESYVGIDLSNECIDACRSTFSSATHAQFVKNDGLSLQEADGSFDLVFSFDSLVHAEIDIFIHYIPQILGKLSAKGVAFIHHSNLHALSTSEVNTHHRATSVDAEAVAGLIRESGGRVFVQEILNWGGPSLSDCMTTFARGDSTISQADPVIIKNLRFMDEAAIIKDYQSHYTGLRQ